MLKRVVFALMVGALMVAGPGSRASAGGLAGGVAQVKEQTIVVRATEYRFTPVLITVDKGTRVTVKLVNEGTEKHEFELDAFDFEIKPIAPGTSAQGSFVADKTGLFEFACHVDEHFEKGMVGFLRVR